MSGEALAWIAGDDTGVSSKAIWRVMMGVPDDAETRRWAFGDYPHDPDDFGRCYRLLKAIPAWRARIGEMATKGEAWAALAARWDEIEALFEEEIGDRRRGSAPKTYALMKAILDPIENRGRARSRV